jgi:hypothetical protein
MIQNIELKMHQTNKILVGQDYVGDAPASLNIMPNGLLALASSATTWRNTSPEANAFVGIKMGFQNNP